MAWKVAAALVAVAAIVGIRLYDKASAHDEVQARLVELCRGDAACRFAVATHYDRCFADSYTMGGRRADARLDLDALVGCLTRAAGEAYFAVEKEQERPWRTHGPGARATASR